MATPQIFINVLCTPQENWQFNSLVVSSADYFCGELSSSTVVDAEASFDFYAESGTYTLDLVHKKTTDRGIYTVQVDGVTEGTIDGYATPAAAARDSITNITIATTGVHRLRLLMASKNVSSSAFRGGVSGAVLTRTGA